MLGPRGRRVARSGALVCRIAGLGTESNSGIVGIAFDPDRYRTCMKAKAP